MQPARLNSNPSLSSLASRAPARFPAGLSAIRSLPARLLMGWCCLSVLAPSPATADLALKDGDTLVFVGDELVGTAEPRKTVTFPLLVETFLTARYPEMTLHYENVGWSGDTAERVLLRLDRDVLSRKPNTVILCVGMNDPEYTPAGQKPEILQQFAANLAEIVTRCKKAGAHLWLVAPPAVHEEKGQTTRAIRAGRPFFVDLAAIHYNQTLAQYATAMKNVAEEHEAGFVDWHGVMAAVLKNDPNSAEEFHSPREARLPTARGHALAATLLLEAMGAEPIEATTTLDWTAGSARTQLPGSRDLPTEFITHGDGRRSLRLKGLPLPWGIPGTRSDPFQPGWRSARMCRLMLEVKNAPARGIDILRPVPKGKPKPEANISTKQAESGFNLAGLAVMRAGQELRNLLNAIRLKHTYLQTAWRRLNLVPPPEPELVEAQRQLATAWTNYAIGYEKIIRRLPKTVDIELILAETVEAKPLPVAQRSAQDKPVPKTAPATAPASQPATRPATQPVSRPARAPAKTPPVTTTQAASRTQPAPASRPAAPQTRPSPPASQPVTSSAPAGR